MKNFTISLGIGLNQLIMEYYTIFAQQDTNGNTWFEKQNKAKPKDRSVISWSQSLKRSIGC